MIRPSVIGLVAALCFSITVQAQRPNLQIRLHAGMNVAKLSSAENPIFNGVSVGYLGGFGFRVSKNKIYGEATFNFIRSGVPIDLRRLGNGNTSSTVPIYAFELPVVVGYRFAKTAFFKWAVYTGLNTLVVTRVKPNDFDFERSGVNNPQWGIRAGSGIDFAFFTFNFNYTYNLPKLLEIEPRVNTHIMQFNVGVIF